MSYDPPSYPPPPDPYGNASVNAGWQQQPVAGPPPGRPRRPKRKRHTWRNIILATLGVMVLVIVIAAAASGGSKPTASGVYTPPAAASSPAGQAPATSVTETPPPSDPTTVTFAVTGDGNGGGADINYGNSADNVSPQDCTIGDLGNSCSVPWSATLPFTGSAEYWNLNAQLGSEGGSITCTITVSGPGDNPLVVATGQASGPYQICDAQAAPTDSSGLSWDQE